MHEHVFDLNSFSHYKKEGNRDLLDSFFLIANDRKGGPLSRAEEFENFKKGKGQEMSRILSENKGIWF